MSGRYTRRVILVVAAADRAAANADAQRAVPGCGPDNLSAPFGPTGRAAGAAPTHYGCSWQVTPEEAIALRAYFGPGNAQGRRMFWGVAGDVATVVDGEVELTPDALFRTLRLERAEAARTGRVG